MDKITLLENMSEDEVVNEISKRLQLIVDNINNKKHTPYYTKKDFDEMFNSFRLKAKQMSLKENDE